MVRLFIILILSFYLHVSYTQIIEPGPFLSESADWMQMGRDYWKIPIADKGIYRISGEELIKRGLPSLEDTLNFQYELYSLGVPIPMLIHHDKENGSYSFLEFYGEGDEGKSDDLLFKVDESKRLNPLFSLFSDTAYYFLSWKQNTNGSVEQANRVDLPLIKKVDQGILQLEEQVVYKDRHLKVFEKWVGVDWASSNFEMEGFASDWYNTLITEISAPGVSSYKKQIPVSSRLAATLTIHLMTNDFDEPHHLQFFINDYFIKADSFSFSSIKSYQFNLPVDYLREYNSVLVKATNGEYDKFAIGCITLSYPAIQVKLPNTFKILNKYNTFPVALQTDENLTELVIWDLNNKYVYNTKTDENGFIFLPHRSIKSSPLYFIQSEKKVIWLNLPKNSFSPIPLPPRNIDLLLISNSFLSIDKNGGHPIEAYLAYRQSSMGGNYTPWLADIKNLENQYGFGIPNHPLAIRGFVNRLIQQNYTLKAILLLGKGREYRDIRNKQQVDNLIANENQPSLIPTWGYPGSDAMLVSSFQNDLPWTSFGRIPAISADEITLYLKKVILFEEKREFNTSWIKEVVQLGGGTYEPEKKYIREVLENFSVLLDRLPWSPKVISFFKENEAPVYIPYSRQFFDAVNAGVGLIIFLGHSTANTFDFNIDNPGFYENGYKQPLFLSLGCYAGNHFTSFRSQGERFLFYAESGAIAFAATRGVGFLNLLAEMGRIIIEQMKGENEFPSWGEVIHKGIQTLMKGENMPLRTMAQQLTFQGDPIVQLPVPGSPKPDFLAHSVRISPHPVLVNNDSFLLEWEILPLGIEPLTTLMVEVSMEGLTESILFVEVINKKLDGNKINIRCPIPKNLNKGTYRLFIKYKKQRWTDRAGMPKTENLEVSYFHTDGMEGYPLQVENRLFIPLFPIDNGMLNDKNYFSLFRASDDLSAQNIHIEWKGDKKRILPGGTGQGLLTNEVIHQSLLFKQDSSVIQGILPFSSSMDEVCYWRAYPEGTDENILKILPFQSFTYSSHSPFQLSLSSSNQFKQGILEGIILNEQDSISPSWQFATVYNTVLIRNKWNETENPPEFIHNGQPIGSPWPWLLPAAIQVMVWDTFAGAWIKNPPGGLYQSKSNGSAMNAWVFDTRNETGRLGLISFLEQGIPHGAYVSIYSAQEKGNGDYKPEFWEEDAVKHGKDLFSVLEGLGASKVRYLKERGAVPYAFHFRKGFGKMDESVAFNQNDIIYAQCNPSKVWHKGSFTSPMLGPALKWKELQLEFKDDVTEHDTVDIEIVGFNPSFPLFKPVLFEQKAIRLVKNQWVIQANDFFLKEIDSILAVKLGIHVGQLHQMGWPFLHVKLNITNRFTRTPLSLNKIQAVFLSLPEFKASIKTSVSRDSMLRNGVFSASWQLENLSSFTTDSLTLTYKILQENNLISIKSILFRPLGPYEIMNIPWQLSLSDLEGDIDVAWKWGLPGDDFFPANNEGKVENLKLPDKFKRSFSIVVNGEHLQQGDYISQRPQWVIEALITSERGIENLDSLSVIASILLPNGLLKPIVWKYEAAEILLEKLENGRKLSIQWLPFFEQEGSYKIQLNMDSYSESWVFEVVKPQKITRVLNYPNPFSRFTQFHYTLSAGENIDLFNVQIFSITGLLVRQLSQEDLGSLKVGTHLTVGGWDGKDTFGDELATGIYIYKLAILNQQIMGKMVLINP